LLGSVPVPMPPPSSPSPSTIELGVTFDVDANGILNITVENLVGFIYIYIYIYN